MTARAIRTVAKFDTSHALYVADMLPLGVDVARYVREIAIADWEAYTARTGFTFGPPPSRFAIAGAQGAEMRKPERDAALRAEEELAAALVRARLQRGKPMTETRWSIGVMAFHVRQEWPLPRRGVYPAPSSIEGYISRAIQRGLLPPVEAWPEDGTFCRGLG